MSGYLCIWFVNSMIVRCLLWSSSSSLRCVEEDRSQQVSHKLVESMQPERVLSLKQKVDKPWALQHNEV